uniref:VIER F-box protein 2 n=1 Tax=Tanacetum cinerariifolium TaxID=118510 RepID=A0A6L2KIL9_TANCI|nr:VIER F-box protein 2 [Tanacetum cinerariifolium]
MTHGSADDMEYDPSNVEFTKWLASKFYNHMTMDQYTKNALWIYWARGDDNVELTDEESFNFDDEDEVAKIFRIDTNLFDFETPMCRAFKEFNYLLQIDPYALTKDINGFKTYKDYKDDWIYEWNKYISWVHKKPWTDNGVWEEPILVKHYCKPSNYKNRCSKWLTCSWKDDGYCIGGNFPGAYIVGNTLCYQDLDWRMDGYEDAVHDHEEREYEMEHEDEERCELFNDTTYERPVCIIRRFEMIKYSFRENEEYVAIKEHEYDDLTSTNEHAHRTYQEIICRMYEVWMSQELKTVSYHKLYDTLKQHQNDVNELRAERLAPTANPLVLVAKNNQFTILKTILLTTLTIPQPDHNKLLPKTKEVNSPPSTYDQKPKMVDDDDVML